MAMMDDEELQAIYTWVDEIPLSRPKRNIARDFSDGVLVAEIVEYYFPKLVELHNYSAANAMKGKLYNWSTLNQKVFKRLSFNVPRSEVEEIIACKPGAVERLLKILRKHMARYRAGRSSSGSSKSSVRGGVSAPNSVSSDRGARRGLGARGGASEERARRVRAPESGARGLRDASVDDDPRGAFDHDALRREVDAEMLTEREQEIHDLRETVELLEVKVQKLEHLVRLKDSKIRTLQDKLEDAQHGYEA